VGTADPRAGWLSTTSARPYRRLALVEHRLWPPWPGERRSSCSATLNASASPRVSNSRSTAT